MTEHEFFVLREGEHDHEYEMAIRDTAQFKFNYMRHCFGELSNLII